MKNIFFTLAFMCSAIILASIPANAQLPPQHWARKYGGSATDVPFVIKATSDGGTIVAGYTTSKDGDVTNDATREYWDLWIVKLDRCGNIIWKKTMGGTGYESARDVIETANGFLILGETNSTDGDVVAGFGGTKDIWLLQVDFNGNLVWQKRLGGTGLDIGNQIVALADGNFLIAATTSSADGIAVGNHGAGGYTDGLLIKIDAAGNVLWNKCFGGSKNEELLDIEIIGDRIYVAGYANSTDGDIPANQKNYDVWVLSVDQSGSKRSSNIYGGSQNDVAYSMTRGAGGTLTIAGYTTSNDGDVSGAKGDQDYWILNVSTTGSVNWQQTLGGTGAEYANYIISDYDGGYITGGITYSEDGDVTGARGEGDFWVVKLNAHGAVVWKQIFGGSETDYLRSSFFKPETREYYIAGDSQSFDGDFSDGNGETDFAIIKFKITDTLSRDTLVCNVASFNLAPQLLQDACGYDSALVTYRPMPLATAFETMDKIDTVFEGQTSVLPTIQQGTITWDPHPTLSCSACSNPIAAPLETTRYTANLQQNNCSASAQFTVIVLKDALVNLPNAFTPNGDGRNDYFGPAGKVPADFEMQIFNRYGEPVFKSNSISTTWDGRYHGVLQSSNVYVYTVKYRNMQSETVHRKGTITLIR
ncbi:MAG: gliding motility-associated C-terminal domain-containing protein [Sphingobacteriales bacterium]|nr:MAG: gliding motility-associated C-terminal domain-containing protein [Sphingobacteriales bacterium]